MSQIESLAQEMKGKSEEKADTRETKKASEDKEGVKEDSQEKKEDPPPSDSAVESAPPPVTYSSPSTPPSLRGRKPPSPPIHSSPDSPISSHHSSLSHGHSPTQDKRFSPSPQADRSPDSSITDDHCSLSDELHPIEDERFSPPPPGKPASPVVLAKRLQAEPKLVTKVDHGAQEGFVAVKGVEEGAGSGVGGSGNRRLRPDVFNLLRSKEEAKLNKTLLGLRIIALMFCLISFSVLAADIKQGWALDSFYLYKEFRYSLSVNVIGFVYSLLQVCDMVKYFLTRKHMVEHYLRGYFSFSIDQMLTYLLMSASSSAAIRAYDWESNWGEDKFPYMANASVGLSFVAFVTFALTSLVSGYMLCRFR